MDHTVELPKHQGVTQDVHHLEACLRRLRAEWKEAQQALGLKSNAPWSQIAEHIRVDRGTAQRLVRMNRLHDPVAEDLEQVPGLQGWQRVLSGVEERISAEHPAYQRLALACDHYGAALERLGGSKASAVRAVSMRDRPPRTPTVEEPSGHREWLSAAADVIGYQLDTRLNLQAARPSRERPGRLDLLTLNSFLGCVGRAGAMPFALFRHTAVSSERLRPEGLPASRFSLLSSGTSKPPPALLSTDDGERQVTFIEPSWYQLGEPIDVTVMLEQTGWTPAPTADDRETLAFSVVNKHPCRRLIAEVHLDPELAHETYTRFGSYRDLGESSPDNWFDRLPEPAGPGERGGFTLDECPPGVAQYEETVAELQRRSGWDLSGFVRHRVVVELPMPLARYTSSIEPTET